MKFAEDRPYADVEAGMRQLLELANVIEADAGRALRALIHLPFKFLVHNRLMKSLRRFLADESGATAIEYGLIAAGISLAIISIVNGIGAKLDTKFTALNNSLK